jgi:hypothetical protein
VTDGPSASGAHGGASTCWAAVGPALRPGAARARGIGDLVRATLGLPADVAVTVQQLACREPGCPPIETVIAVLQRPPRRWTLHRPVAEIDNGLVTGLLTNDPYGETHEQHQPRDGRESGHHR